MEQRGSAPRLQVKSMIWPAKKIPRREEKEKPPQEGETTVGEEEARSWVLISKPQRIMEFVVRLPSPPSHFLSYCLFPLLLTEQLFANS